MTQHKTEVAQDTITKGYFARCKHPPCSWITAILHDKDYITYLAWAHEDSSNRTEQERIQREKETRYGFQ